MPPGPYYSLSVFGFGCLLPIMLCKLSTTFRAADERDKASKQPSPPAAVDLRTHTAAPDTISIGVHPRPLACGMLRNVGAASATAANLCPTARALSVGDTVVSKKFKLLTQPDVRTHQQGVKPSRGMPHSYRNKFLRFAQRSRAPTRRVVTETWPV